MGNNRLDKLLNYVSTPLTDDKLKYLYKLNNISIEKVELFSDFSITLCKIVTSTYLGHDIIVDSQITNHFNWCFNKTINLFEKQGFYFSIEGEHYYFFLNYFKSVLYETNLDTITNDLEKNMVNYWLTTFNINDNKTKAQFDSFNDIYRILDKNFMNNY